MKKICALLFLIMVTLSGCYVDPYRDHDHHDRDESGYGRDGDHRDQGDHERNREDREEHDNQYRDH